MLEKIRVVIADDEDNYRKAIQKTLSFATDVEVLAVCRDGQEAFDACQAEAPDVLLTDINMPRVSGIEVTRRLLRKEKDLKIVILTVREDDDTVFEAFRAGALGYLLKTSTPQEVIESVRLAARGEAKITPKIATKVIEDFRRVEKTAVEFEEATDELLRNREIADRLGIAEKTVKNHVSNILKALQVNSRTEAAMKAVKNRISGS
jgi:DNA-binding NarL/FixJ family response regulator